MALHLFDFEARDVDGHTYPLSVWAGLETAASQGEPTGHGEVTREIRTKDGLVVDRLGKGQYRIGDTGVQLSSDDPRSP
jgi:hypothetical protein